MLTGNSTKSMLTKIQQMLIVEENYIFLLFDTIQMFFKRKIFVNIAETLFTAIFSKENILFFPAKSGV